MKTKQFMSCLMALSFLLAFTACNKDDDDNGPAFSKDGKRLIKSVSYDDWEANREKEVFNFKYNGDGQMTEMIVYYTYESDEDNRTYTTTETYSFSVSGKTLTTKYVYKDVEDPEENDSQTGTFTLNEDGFVISGKGEDSEGSYSYQCSYNEDRQLIQTICPSHNGTKNYTWVNNNYTQITQYRNGHSGWSENYSYYDIENKTNIDLGSLVYEGLGDDDFSLSLAGFQGKASKNLLKSSDFYTYTYEYDSEGYVTKITRTTGRENMIYFIQYN